MKRFRYLPHALQVMSVSLAVGPLGAALAAALNFEPGDERSPWYAAYVAVTYMALPWLLAALLVRRQAAFLAAFGAECALLFAHLFLVSGAMPAYLRFTHYAFSMMACALALMLVNRDILFPFLFASYRGFRRAPRVGLNLRVTVLMPRIDRSFDAMIEDASLSGLAVYGFEDAMSDMLALSQRGEALVVTYRSAKTTVQVHGWFLWSTQASSVVKIGFRAADAPAMAVFFAALGLGARPRGTRRRWQAVWSRRGVRRALNYGLALAILALLMVPVVDRGTRRTPVPSRPNAAAKKVFRAPATPPSR